LLTLIETLGLQEKQEAAFEGLVRREVWGFIPQFGCHVDREMHAEIRSRYDGIAQGGQTLEQAQTSESK
jgi:hypothetical protein